MSYVGFIVRALALSPFVFLRYVPIVAILVFIIYGLFLTTENPWVIGMILFLLSTVGVTFLIVQGLRAGLMSIRATAPPTAEGLLNVTIKMMFSLMILQLVAVIVLTAGMYWVSVNFILSDAAVQAAGLLTGFYREIATFDLEAAVEFLPALEVMRLDPAPLNEAIFVITTGYYLVLGLPIAFLGIPMAAFAANAVQHSPKNDLIFGMGSYFPHQYTIWLIVTVIPVALYTLYFPPDLLNPSLAEEAEDAAGMSTFDIGYLIWSIFAPCASFAGMALGYRAIQERVKKSREAERVPEVDWERERERVRSLRQTRVDTAKGQTLYDPRKKD